MSKGSKSLSRRAVLHAAAATAAAAAVPSGLRAVAATPRQARPNIVFLMADDLGYADVSCYGRRDYTTPNIDAIAAGGMRFLQAYANSSVCSPTRTALMTGRYQYRLPVGLDEPIATRDVGLPPSHPTLPSLLRKSGYATMLIGKWHLGLLPKHGPLQSGYEHFWGFRAGAVDYFTHGAMGRADLWDGDTPVSAAGYLTDLLGDRAVAGLDILSRSGKPFFLSLHFSAPHWPWEGPLDEPEARRLAAAKDLRSILHLDGGTLKTYAAMVTRMDLQIGRVLERLDALGLSDNTIVIFTSDNGGERFSDTWPFSGMKTELLEGGIRVPAIVRWPGHVPAGRSSEQVMISMDWVPTLLRAAGTHWDPDFPPDGVDIGPALSGAASVPRTLFWRQMTLMQQACREGDWKYLKILDNRFLFNVVEDPQERANLEDRHPEIFDSLIRKWQAWNATMLPLDPAAYTHAYTGEELADHYGVQKPPAVESGDERSPP